MIKRNASRGTKPLTSSAFYVLLALVDEPRHGLGIASEVEARTGGDVRLGPGTLYNAIKKLLDEKLIAEVHADPDDDPRRRYYRITRSGRAALTAEAEKLDRVVEAARAKEVLP